MGIDDAHECQGVLEEIISIEGKPLPLPSNRNLQWSNLNISQSTPILTIPGTKTRVLDVAYLDTREEYHCLGVPAKCIPRIAYACGEIEREALYLTEEKALLLISITCAESAPLHVVCSIEKRNDSGVILLLLDKLYEGNQVPDLNSFLPAFEKGILRANEL